MTRVEQEPARGASEADEATRGSAIKLAAEIGSRLLLLATTAVLARGLGVEDYGAFGRLSVFALLLAELGELGLQATASRALVAGTLSLRSLVRTRAVLFAVLVALVLTDPGHGLERLAAPLTLVLALLVLYFALSGWGEFLGVALRCRGARVDEAMVLLALRAGGLVLAAAALLARGGLVGVAWGLALSPLPALALGFWLVLRHPAPGPAPAASVGTVLVASLPLAVHSGLVLLSPRVEFLVLSLTRDDHTTGLFYAALQVLWFLGMVPAAVAAGAMPALTREALRGEGPVRQRTSATMVFLAAPAAVGLLLVAPGLLRFLFGSGYEAAAPALRVLALAVVPLFLNLLVAWALIAAGRAARLPQLTALRVGVAFMIALALIPRFGAVGAAAGLVLAESLLLGLGAFACSAAGFPVPVARPAALALVATVPMVLAVRGVRDSLFAAVVIGALTYGATLAAAWRLLPGLAARTVGGLGSEPSAARTSAGGGLR